MSENPVNIIKIIEKYKNEINNIIGNTEKDIFTNFYTHVDRDIIQGWVKETFIKSSLKSDEKSIDLRNVGNGLFKHGDYSGALKKYTDSLNYALYYSENFSLALANRSAILFALKDYKNCITDIILCLDNNYPENLKYKIYLRLIKCYTKIFKFEKALETIEILKKHLNNNEKKDEILAELLEIEKYISENNSFDTPETIEKQIVIPTFLENEKNKNYASASNLINLQYNKTKGRHVMAAQDIKTGEILFIEKSFSSVPIFDPEIPNLQTVCYHCFSITVCPIPCKKCLTQFCSENCLNKCWDAYHRFECTGSCAGIWAQVGVNYLAARMLILGATSGYKNVFSVSGSEVEKFGDPCCNYEYVCSLVTNVGKMDKNDVFPHVVSSMVIINYLQDKTDFFQFVVDSQKKLGIATFENRENLPIMLGGILLKHILQVIANATTIESVKPDFYNLFNSTEQIRETGYYFSGVGIYPSSSMMNHSCDVNITNYFIQDYLIIKSKFDIKKGEEIFNSYGYDCRKQVTIGRKAELKQQHFFECDCTACTVPSKPEIFHEGLLCNMCKGLSLSKENDFYECTVCEHEFNAKNHFTYIKKAEQLYEKYERTNDVDLLKKCLELRQKVFYKFNFCIYTSHLDLQNYYGVNGDIKMWWYHTQMSLELDKDILGENAFKVGFNLRLCLLVLLRYLSSLNIEEKNNIRKITLFEMIENANIMLNTMKNIFKLYYDDLQINYAAIDGLLQDCITIVTHIIGEELYINTIEDDLNELYFDQLSDLQ